MVMSFGINTRSVRSANTRDQPKAGANDPDQFEAGATTGAPAGAI